MIPFITSCRCFLRSRKADALAAVFSSGWCVAGGRRWPVRGAGSPSTSARRDAVAVRRVTSALAHRAARAGCRPGDEVSCRRSRSSGRQPSVRYCGATPVFADSSRLTPKPHAGHGSGSISPLSQPNADQGPSWPCTRAGCRPTWTSFAPACGVHPGGGGCRCARVRPRPTAPFGRAGRFCWRRGRFPPRKLAERTGEGGMLTHRRSSTWPASFCRLPRARHERVRGRPHKAARLTSEAVPGSRLQLSLWTDRWPAAVASSNWDG